MACRMTKTARITLLDDADQRVQIAMLNDTLRQICTDIMYAYRAYVTDRSYSFHYKEDDWIYEVNASGRRVRIEKYERDPKEWRDPDAAADVHIDTTVTDIIGYGLTEFGITMPAVPEGWTILIDIRTTRKTLREVMDLVQQYQQIWPDKEIYMDGDTYAIVAVPRK